MEFRRTQADINSQTFVVILAVVAHVETDLNPWRTYLPWRIKDSIFAAVNKISAQ